MTKAFDFKLPSDLIAQSPASPRDHARLLVYNRDDDTIVDDYFYNLLTYLPEPTCVVVNNSKVEHCRLLFDGGTREIFITEVVNDRTVRALIRPGKQFKQGVVVDLAPDLKVTVVSIDSEGLRTLHFSQPLTHPAIEAARHVPLPPYIAQNDALAKEYQTVFAKQLGSKAAPTAGLHFTPELIAKVKMQRDWAEITLHVGLGTFASLTDENIKTGRLHEEQYEISPSVAQIVTKAKHVTAVGTTTVRTIESAYQNHRMAAGVAQTDIFIRPGYEFKRVNALVTNFHLPGTSLLLLVSAFIGSDDTLERIYRHAIEEQYRFYSFGDAMLVL